MINENNEDSEKISVIPFSYVYLRFQKSVSTRAVKSTKSIGVKRSQNNIKALFKAKMLKRIVYKRNLVYWN